VTQAGLQTKETMDKRLVKTRKFLSLVLRHQPDKIGLKLDEGGWADVDCSPRSL
jgi:putative RNA 2'-phosphotransferase